VKLPSLVNNNAQGTEEEISDDVLNSLLNVSTCCASYQLSYSRREGHNRNHTAENLARNVLGADTDKYRDADQPVCSHLISALSTVPSTCNL